MRTPSFLSPLSLSPALSNRMGKNMSSHSVDPSEPDSDPEDLLSSFDQLSLNRDGISTSAGDSDEGDSDSDDSDGASIHSSSSLSTVTNAQAISAEFLMGNRAHSTAQQKLLLLQALLVEFGTFDVGQGGVGMVADRAYSCVRAGPGPRSGRTVEGPLRYVRLRQTAIQHRRVQESHQGDDPHQHQELPRAQGFRISNG